MKPQVAISFPRRTEMRRDDMVGKAVWASQGGRCQVYPFASSSSLLNHCFNTLWCEVHNLIQKGVELTHWAIQHDDIDCDPSWVDTLYDELERTGADFIAAHAPIKDSRGVASMAVYQDDIWDYKRFTMAQLMGMSETFTEDDVDGNLILNTGCCLLRLRDPWLSHPERFVFRTLERIERDTSGQRVPKVVPEDWLFTDDIRKAGGKLAATRKVGLIHHGSDHPYPNNKVWGRWEIDEYYAKKHGEGNENQVPSRLQIPAERPLAVA